MFRFSLYTQFFGEVLYCFTERVLCSLETHYCHFAKHKSTSHVNVNSVTSRFYLIKQGICSILLSFSTSFNGSSAFFIFCSSKKFG